MSMNDYLEALKLGQKEYQKCVAHGEYPYLSVLEEITSHVVIDSEVPIGVVQIPLRKIVGTNARSRSTAFARNFMPLLESNTEFAQKWMALCNSHLEEGIRDSIKCYEYLNRYYVVEGNKRVSVLKYFDAVTINAEVIRVIPRYREDDENIRLYYKFLDFYKVCQVNYLWFSKEESFARILEVLKKTQPEDWDADFKKEFFSCYTRFDKAYTELGGKRLERVTTGDAFLKYLEVFGYEGLDQKLHAQVLQEVRQLWDELVLMETPEPVDLVQDPEQTKKPDMIERLISGAPNPNRHLKIGFVHDKNKETSNWTYAHELGRNYLEEVFGGQVETVVCNDVFNDPRGPEQVMETMIDDGCQVLFTTTPRLAQAALSVAVKHPKVRVLNCAINSESSHMRSYYGRLYEPKFIGGMVAGSLTRTNKIGYVADYPVSGMLSNINAFARGAHMVNPMAQVYLVWSTVKGTDIDKAMWEYGVDLVNNQDMVSPSYGSRQFGLYQWQEDGTLNNISMSIWHWGKFYERIVRSILNGSWRDEDPSAVRSINYWWGLSAGVVDIMYSRSLPADTRRLIEFMKKMIINGEFDPFAGLIVDQQGRVRSPEDGYLTTRERMNMDWLIDNVVGTIPEVWAFKEEAQPLLWQEGMKLPVVTAEKKQES